MSKFKPSLLTIALATAGLTYSFIPNYVYAQEAETEEKVAEEAKSESDDSENSEEDNKLVITGFKGSVIRSLDEKRYADTITEQISADDLGSLPDTSIADALTRLPGVAAIRTGGKASEINIRGLSGIFVHTTLNGREQVSTSGSRSVEFAQYPSELISAATVYKSQKASLIEGGVAGTVDLQTVSPLSMKEDHEFSVNLRGTYNDRANEIYDAESTGNRFSFSYKGKFADDTLGLAAGYSRLYQPSVATQFIGLAYNAQTDVDNIAGDIDGPTENPSFEYLSEGFEMQHRGGETTRNGFVGVLEWAPTDDFVLKADAFISKFDEEAFARGFRVKFDATTANIANAVIDDNAVIGADLTRGRIGSNTRVELVNDNNVKIDDVENYGVNAQWDLTNQFTLFGDLSYSKGSSDFQNGLLWGLVSEDATIANPVLDNDVAISYRLNGLDLPDVGFNQDFTNIDQVMISKYGIYPYQFDDDIKAIKFDGIYETINNDIFSSFEFGIRYSERNYRAKRSVFEYGADNRFHSQEEPLRLSSDMVTRVNFEGEFAHFPSYLAVDYNAALAAWFPNGVPQPLTTFGVNSDGEIDYHSDWSVRQSGQVWEDVLASYFVANIDTEISDVPVTGNLGVRIISTDQFSTKLVDVGGDQSLGAQYITDEAGLISDRFAPSVEGLSYTDVLPQLNLNFKITDNSQIRFSAARVMARTEINRLIADFNIRYDEDDGEAHVNSTNSPLLKPFFADQFDLSYEYYFEETDGAFVFALFRKDLKSFVQEFTDNNPDFDALGISIPEYVPGFEPGNPDSEPPVQAIPGSFTTAVNNANGGSFSGFEIAYTQIFSNLPGKWAGLGMSMSYANTDSDIDAIVGLTTTDLGGPTVNTTFPGLSKEVLNAAVFWDYEGFDTRLNMRHRTSFVSSQFAVDRQQTYFDDETVLDYQASYRFDDNLSVLFQATNLTDEPTKSYFGHTSQTGTIQFFGRQYFLGFNYKM